MCDLRSGVDLQDECIHRIHILWFITTNSKQCTNVLWKRLARARGSPTVPTSIVFFQFRVPRDQNRICLTLIHVFFLLALGIRKLVRNFLDFILAHDCRKYDVSVWVCFDTALQIFFVSNRNNLSINAYLCLACLVLHPTKHTCKFYAWNIPTKLWRFVARTALAADLASVDVRNILSMLLPILCCDATKLSRIMHFGVTGKQRVHWRVLRHQSDFRI